MDRAERRNDAVLPPQIWAQSDNGNDYSPLLIDPLLPDLFNPQLSMSLPDKKRVAGRALEVGYLEVMRVRRGTDDLKASGFDAIEMTAENAAATTDRLIRQLAGRSFKGKARELEIPILTLQAGLQKGSPHGLHARAMRETR
jgi:hypothetical protein